MGELPTQFLLDEAEMNQENEALEAVRNQLEEHFFRVRDEEETIKDFERWVYNADDLSEVLHSDDYLRLIALNFSKRGVWYDIEEILDTYIDYGKRKTAKLKAQLTKLVAQEGDLVALLSSFYYLYDDEGYYFLDNLGLHYGYPMWSIAFSDANQPEEVEKQQELLQSLLPGAIAEAKKVLAWLDNGEIFITSDYEIVDRRTD